eukprot:jgi/Ulvmu1/8178/UM040_0075.1
MSQRRQGKGKAKSQPAPASAASLFKAAEESQQRGERRRGEEAIRHFQLAVDQFKQCIQLGLDGDQRGHAHVLCAESLQGWAQNVRAAEASLPDEQQSHTVEAAAKAEASKLFQQALQASRMTLDPASGAWARADAATNCGNCLAEAAELLPAAQQAPPLEEAVACYRAALALEEDALTWSNLADVLIQLAQAHAAQGQHSDMRATVEAARAAYVSSTALSDSAAGDDLPGLLCNWGTGLTAAGGMLREAGDTAAALAALRDAVLRLECSVDFKPSDIQVHMALAEARCGLAESLTAAAREAGGPAQHAEHAAAAEAAMAGALAACDAAQRITRNHTGAAVVLAETLTATARATAVLGSSERAADFAGRAWTAYGTALRAPGDLSSCSERSTVRYNAACAAARCGATADALRLLTFVSTKDPSVLHGAESDEDLQPLRSLPEFQALLQTSKQGGNA